jgi:cell division septation protein DedD|tara:strand:- start:2600 stop:2947 length:348 start_codon:yes stop_codon:yes gene_type:complete
MISVLFSQETPNDWLSYTIIDSNKKSIEKISLVDDIEFYYTIQIAVKKSFVEAMEILKQLNENDIDAFIQKNDKSSEFKYRVRYGNFSQKKDAKKIADYIYDTLGYECWIDKNEL